MQLSKLRDLAILIGIYLYFIAWIYLHEYYSNFGISTSALKIDYSSYLIYSYNVIASGPFLSTAAWIAGIWGLLWLVSIPIIRRRVFKVRRWAIRIRRITPFIVLIILFPLLVTVAKSTALKNYVADRTHTGNLRRIEFDFSKEAAIDSSMIKMNPNIQLLTSDKGQNLRLLAETDDFFIVLFQAPLDPEIGSYPEGEVYYVDKKIVSFARIILSSR